MPVGVEELLRAAETCETIQDGQTQKKQERCDNLEVDKKPPPLETLRFLASAKCSGMDLQDDDAGKAVKSAENKHWCARRSTSASSDDDLLSPNPTKFLIGSKSKKENDEKSEDPYCHMHHWKANHQNHENTKQKSTVPQKDVTSSTGNKEETEFTGIKNQEQIIRTKTRRIRSVFGKKLGSFSEVDISEPTSSVTNSDLLEGSGGDDSGDGNPSAKEKEKEKVDGLKNPNAEDALPRREVHDVPVYPKRLQLREFYNKTKTSKRTQLLGNSGQGAPKEVTFENTAEPISSISASGRSSSSSEENSITSQQAVYHFSTNRSDDEAVCENEGKPVNDGVTHGYKRKIKKDGDMMKKKPAKSVQIIFPANEEQKNGKCFESSKNAVLKKGKRDKKRKATAATSIAGASTQTTPSSDFSHTINRTGEKPKRPLSAYNYFFRDERARILVERQQGEDRVSGIESQGKKVSIDSTRISNNNGSKTGPGGDGNAATIDAASASCKKSAPHRRISFENLGKLIAARWKKLKSDERAKYQDMAEQDLLRYRQEMDDYYERENAKRRAMYFPDIGRNIKCNDGSGSSKGPVSSMDTSSFGVSVTKQTKESSQKLKREAYEAIAARKMVPAPCNSTHLSEERFGVRPQGSTAFGGQSTLPTQGLGTSPQEGSTLGNFPADLSFQMMPQKQEAHPQAQQVQLHTLPPGTVQQLQSVHDLLNQIAMVHRRNQLQQQSVTRQTTSNSQMPAPSMHSGLETLQMLQQQQQQQQQFSRTGHSSLSIAGNVPQPVPPQPSQSHLPIGDSGIGVHQNATNQNNVNQMLVQLLSALLPPVQQQQPQQQHVNQMQQSVLSAKVGTAVPYQPSMAQNGTRDMQHLQQQSGANQLQIFPGNSNGLPNMQTLNGNSSMAVTNIQLDSGCANAFGSNVAEPNNNGCDNGTSSKNDQLGNFLMQLGPLFAMNMQNYNRSSGGRGN